jgi:O-antigen/teichoic acid export membrane protein
MIYSVLLATELIGRLGMPQALTKLGAEREEGRGAIESSGLLTGLVVYGALFLLFWVAAPALAEWLHVPDGSFLFRIASVDIPFYGMLFVLVGVLNGRQLYTFSAAVTGLYAVAKMLGVLAIALVGVTIEGALIVNSASSAVGVVAALVGTGLAWPGPTRQALVEILRYAAPSSVRGLTVQLLGNVGLWSLGIGGTLVSADARGFYAAATSLARLPSVLAIGITGLLVGTIAAALGRGDRAAATRTLAGAARAMMILLAPASVLLALQARDIMALLFAPEYAAGGYLLAILVFGQGLAFTFALVFGSALVGASRVQSAMYGSLGGLAVTLVGAALLVPWLGALGAAIATTLGFATVAGIAGWIAWRAIGPWLSPGEMVRIAVAIVPAALLATWWHTDGPALLLELAALGALQLLLLAATGALRRDDLLLIIGRPTRDSALRQVCPREPRALDQPFQ